jgi:hypothetical protein
VKGDIFQGPDSPAVNEINLTSLEIRETSTVLADDPFRAIQALPGVSASGNNDFFAQFSVMGAPFDDVSTYIDGILVPQPFHGSASVNVTREAATLSLLTSETVEDIKLLPVAYPQKYGDAVGAGLDIQTREGSRTPPIFRVSVGLADTELLGEGQLGKGRKGSWLASARKSYLGYLLRSRLNETFTDISFYDVDLKLVYDLRPNQTVTFYGLGGHTVADLVHPPHELDKGQFKSGTDDLILLRGGWRWTVNPHLLLDTRSAYLATPVTIRDVNNTVVDDTHYHEWIEGGSLIWLWRKDQVLEGGWTARYGHRTNGFGPARVTATGWRTDGYVQQASSLFGNRLHLLGSLRFDTASQYDIHPLSPQLSASLEVTHSTAIQFSVGRYNQFGFPALPGVMIAGTSLCVPASENLDTANHFSAGVEHRIGESARVRAIFFDRQNQSQATRSGGCPLFPPLNFQNVGQNYSRGVEFVVQSRSANRLSGWIGYTYVFARQNQFFSINLLSPPFLSPYFPTLEDQHHSLNVFASYRLTPSIKLSGKFLYGSGFPVPSGTIDTTKSPPQLVGWNATRLSDYQRLDVRAEKDWAFTKWKLALYGEMLNLTNHFNPRFIQTGLDPQHNPIVFAEQGLPITPTAGVAFEF